MLSVIPSLFGSLSALLTNGVQFFIDRQKNQQAADQDKRDKQHELDILDRQDKIDAIKAAEATQQVIITSDADVTKSVNTSIDNAINSKIDIIAMLNGIIRPLITIAHAGWFFYLLQLTFSYAVLKGLTPLEINDLKIFMIFFETFQFIMTFWFTNRTIDKLKNCK